MPNDKKEKINTEKIKKNFISVRLVNKLLLLSIIISGCYYLVCMNCLSLKGFEIKEKRVALNEKYRESNNLQLQIMSLDSYSLLNDKVESLKMVKVDKVGYIGSNESLAKK